MEFRGFLAVKLSKRREWCDSSYWFLFSTSKIQTVAKNHFHGFAVQGDCHWLRMDERLGIIDLVEAQVCFGNWLNFMEQGTSRNNLINVTSVSTRFLRMHQRSWGWLQLRTGEQHFWLERFDWRALRQFDRLNHWWPVLDVQGFREEVLGEENKQWEENYLWGSVWKQGLWRSIDW